MSAVDLGKLVSEAIGLDIAAIGAPTFRRAIRERCAACGVGGPEAYREYLSANPEELQQLIELLVVPETWFFRDRPALAEMSRFALRLHASNPNRLIRLISIPCASGEEPYSMAMALLDAGVPTNCFHIDAVDISAVALSAAKRGEFGKNSFRDLALGFRAKYFDPLPHAYRINALVRDQVSFGRGNFLDPGFPARRSPYDVVFCRNLLIYFDLENQARATRALARILDPAGLLFVGPSETILVAKHGFVPLKAPMAFAFQTAVARASHRRTRAPIVPASRKPEAAIEASTTKRHLARPSPEKRPSSEAVFAAIRQLADAGNLAEAAQRCEDYLRGGDAAAEAFHLLGVIRDADGKLGEAEACYRRALYLDPDHEEALIHLRSLLERIGDSTGAKVVGERMQRLERAGRR